MKYEILVENLCNEEKITKTKYKKLVKKMNKLRKKHCLLSDDEFYKLLGKINI